MADWKNYIPPRAGAGRFFKYLFLFVALAITIKIVFDGFSYYLARRSLDSELEAKKISSLEYLGVLSKRERAFVIDSLETRCTERSQLAIFRTLDAKLQPKLREAHLKSLELRSAIIVKIDSLAADHKEWADLVDLADLKKQIRRPTFSVSFIRDAIKPAGTIKTDDARYQELSKAVIDEIEKDKDIKSYLDKLAEYDGLRTDALKVLGKEGPDFKNIEILERRIDRLKEARKENKDKLKDLDDVLARYAVWTDALTGGVGDSPILDEMAFQLGDDDRRRLDQIDCERFEKYFLRVTGRPLDAKLLAKKAGTDSPPPPEKAPADSKPQGATKSEQPATAAVVASPGFVEGVSEFYRGRVSEFFNIPPVAQTLFVTLMLGALGALTINTLRLSKIGWWAPMLDPRWGELLLSPFLGALAAFGIFLLGSTGLLLTGDVKSGSGGATSLSAFFIGMLGFVSGLVYDEAFGRVRRFGAQLFAEGGASALAAPEDRSLADELRAAGASSVAELVLKFGIGKRLSGETEFTLLVPSDAALGGLTLSAWREISDPATRSKFDDWFRRHHATTRVNKSDVAEGKVNHLDAESGAEYLLSVDGDVLQVKGIKVQESIVWGNGAIHVLHEDVP